MKKIILRVVFIGGLLLNLSRIEAKEADLAGMWYSASPEVLGNEIETYLHIAQAETIKERVIGVVIPHAGLSASGEVAAYAYKALADKNPEQVIVVGFTHRFYLPGKISVFTDKDFVTPLGKTQINTDMAKKFISYSLNIQDIPQAFETENSVEMQIPFIQTVFKNAKITLIALCDQSLSTCRLLSDALSNILKEEKDFLIIASSDMCHYLSYETANKKDAQTINAINTFDPEKFYAESLKAQHELMCGYGAVYAAMLACKNLGANEVKVLKYANSGDTMGQKDKVVGYLSAGFIIKEAKEENAMFNQTQKTELLKIARESIEHYLATGKRFEVETKDDLLRQNMGAFATLRKWGELRGCIGNMSSEKPLYLTVRDMAQAAAIQDMRFSPVTLKEMEDIDIEISVLSPMKKIDDYTEIKVRKHGVLVRMGSRSGVYLPQVAEETGWDREQFMNSLCAHKAGIPQDAWKTRECDIYIFTAEVFGEKG